MRIRYFIVVSLLAIFVHNLSYAQDGANNLTSAQQSAASALRVALANKKALDVLNKIKNGDSKGTALTNDAARVCTNDISNMGTTICSYKVYLAYQQLQSKWPADTEPPVPVRDEEAKKLENKPVPAPRPAGMVGSPKPPLKTATVRRFPTIGANRTRGTAN